MSDVKSLLPPNSTEVEKNLELATARLGSVPTNIRDIHNPDDCPAELLPWLAWAYSLDSWPPYWPDAVKRQQIKQSVDIQRHKGTSKSVRDVVAGFGASLALKEWWQTTPPGVQHTFDILMIVGSGLPTTAEYQQDIIDEVNRTKPVRSHFTLTAGVSAEGGFGLQGVARPVVYKRLSLVDQAGWNDVTYWDDTTNWSDQ